MRACDVCGAPIGREGGGRRVVRLDAGGGGDAGKAGFARRDFLVPLELCARCAAGRADGRPGRRPAAAAVARARGLLLAVAGGRGRDAGADDSDCEFWQWLPALAGVVMMAALAVGQSVAVHTNWTGAKPEAAAAADADP